MHLERFATSEEFIKGSVGAIKAALAASAPSFCALSGGKTPLPVYQALAADTTFSVENTEFFLVDERVVSKDSLDSNYAAIVKAFGAAEPFFSDHFHFFDTDRAPSETVAAYAKQLAQVPDGRFDLIILGLGEDGHTASLFPRSAANAEKNQLVVAAINATAPNPPVRERLTITWPVILKAKKILVLLSGKNKENALKRLISGPTDQVDFPAAHLQAHPAVEVYFGP